MKTQKLIKLNLNENLEKIIIKMINILRIKCHADGCESVIPPSICDCNKYRSHRLDTTTSIVWQTAMRIMTHFGEIQKGEKYSDSFQKVLTSIVAYRCVVGNEHDTMREKIAYRLIDLSLNFVENLKLYMQSEKSDRLSGDDRRIELLLNINNCINQVELTSHIDHYVERMNNEQGTNRNRGEICSDETLESKDL